MFQWLSADGGSGYFTVSVISFALTTACALLIVNRMKNLGFSARDLKRKGKVFLIFSGYWNIAPKRAWSRLPTIVMVASIGAGVIFWFLSVKRH